MNIFFFSSRCCCSVAQSCPTLCNPMDRGMPGFLILHYLPFVQTHVHWVSDAHPTISGSSVVPFSSCHPWGISLTLCVLLLVLTLNHFVAFCECEAWTKWATIWSFWASSGIPNSEDLCTTGKCPFTDSMTSGLATDPCELQVLLWILTDVMWENGVALSHMPFKCYFIKKMIS